MERTDDSRYQKGGKRWSSSSSSSTPVKGRDNNDRQWEDDMIGNKHIRQNVYDERWKKEECDGS